MIVIIVYYLYKYFRRIREEEARFSTLEPEFKEFDREYQLNQPRNNEGVFGSIFNKI